MSAHLSPAVISTREDGSAPPNAWSPTRVRALKPIHSERATNVADDVWVWAGRVGGLEHGHDDTCKQLRAL